MTFDEYFERNVAPTLPNDIPPQLRDAARAQLAQCWNEAISAAWNASKGPLINMPVVASQVADCLNSVKVNP